MKLFYKPKSHTRGFTLIELLVVIAIISLLSSVILAALRDARDKAKKNVFRQEMNQLVNALELYKNDKGSYPSGVSSIGSTGVWGGSLNNLVPTYIPILPKIIPPYVDGGIFYLGTSVDVKCANDTNLSPYIIGVGSNVGLNYDAVSDWESGYYAGYTYFPNVRCFSIE